jgi:hypothetical protein
MKTIIKLLIAAAILHAVVRGGMSASTYYRLKDTTQELIVFGAGASIPDLEEGILIKAEELSVPVEPENVTVRRDVVRTVAEVSYTDAIEFLPRYRYPIDYSFRVEALSLQSLPTQPVK